ncbi:hypothetical protein AMS68_000174 [Peltaster fructicola]|uniref:Glycosyl transferase family 25 domain-containing protein n=1 Tax=Peltaster fructicola TaxID=286661 RepID=A0A6H0XIV4_9PEZI|nr:hypothetical protein AMS68_000174 [Peltaster fructicola]
MALMAPQFMRDSSGAVSARRIAVAVGLAILTFWLLAASFGRHVPIPNYVRHYRQDKLLESIQNSTLGFERILVINLKARTDRRDGIALAGSLTNLKFEFMEAATEVSLKSLPPRPPGDEDREYGPAHLGCWRSHLNAARYIVENNLQTALVMEDDADWDVRIHDQMTDLARATRLLVQPIPGVEGAGEQFLDPTIGASLDGQQPQTFIAGAHDVKLPTSSPYGDIHRWDMLWIGHCGSSLPDGSNKLPLGRAIILNETTVPEQHHINFEFTDDDGFKNEYPAHTRVVFRGGRNVCTLAYALTLNGARKIMYEMGIRQMASTADGGLSDFCTGADNQAVPVCLSAQPQYFQHHRPAGNISYFTDISDPWSDGINTAPHTDNLRWPTRPNIPKLLKGETDFEDNYPDGS